MRWNGRGWIGWEHIIFRWWCFKWIWTVELPRCDKRELQIWNFNNSKLGTFQFWENFGKMGVPLANPTPRSHVQHYFFVVIPSYVVWSWFFSEGHSIGEKWSTGVERGRAAQRHKAVAIWKCLDPSEHPQISTIRNLRILTLWTAWLNAADATMTLLLKAHENMIVWSTTTISFQELSPK